MKKSIVLNSKTTYLVFISIIIAFPLIRIFVDVLFTSLFGSSILGELLFYFVLLVIIILSYRYLVDSIRFSYIIVLGIWFIYCLYMARQAKMDSAIYVGSIKYIIIFGGLFFLVGQSIADNCQLVRNQLFKLPIFLNLMGILIFLVRGNSSQVVYENGATESANYSMELSYANLIAALISTVVILVGNNYELIYNNNQYTYICLINLFISYLLVGIGGSRGPIFSLLIIATIAVIYSIIKSNRNSIAYLILIIGIIFIIFLLGLLLLPSISNGYFRIIDLIQSNPFNSSGREHYINSSLTGISENILGGTGVFNDRIYIYNHFHRSYAVNSSGSYSHNIFLEVLLQFGIIGGGIIVIALLALIIISFNRALKNNTIEVFLVLLGMGFVPLLVSKSYVQSWEFYLLLGYMLGMSVRTKYHFIKKYAFTQI